MMMQIANSDANSVMMEYRKTISSNTAFDIFRTRAPSSNFCEKSLPNIMNDRSNGLMAFLGYHSRPLHLQVIGKR